MIELTEQQVQALEALSGVDPLGVTNPKTNEQFVLLPIEDYRRLKVEEYDDSPWTEEEMMALAEQTAKLTGWDEWDEDLKSDSTQSDSKQ